MKSSRGAQRVLVVADPDGNLDAAYKEGLKIRDEIGGETDFIEVSLASSKVDVHYVKKNLRDFDIIHYAGHADYNSDVDIYEILHGVYPEQKDEILRYAQNDKRRVQNDKEGNN